MLNGQNCCNVCSIPLDAEYFDESTILEEEELPQRGERALLARFQVHPQYCGALTCFSQFSDAYAIDNSKVRTPGLRWILMRNSQPLFPYHKLESIVNPWGYGGFGFLIRLDENSLVEFVLENRSFDFQDQEICSLGGRIMGRYWYNKIYGHR